MNKDIKVDAGRFYFKTECGIRDAVPEDIGYVLSTPTVPEFLTGREFLKFFMDIHEEAIRNPKTPDEYFDDMSIDVVVAEEMKQLLRSLKDGRIIIFSTHIMDLALDLCDEIVLLSHGELEIVDKADLNSREFKEKIIAVLREEDNA